MNDIQSMVTEVVEMTQSGDHLLVMSNGGFEAIHQRLLDALQARMPV
ncbi:MAG: hypothetical protein KZQ66_06715 [Candidatus Thiodiazotropha sp. (ex Lucinoma aequizonata)]|nr:hypothetical protein [Candidatus Thiodiazotropha sp. (ex Lucinoma aequizonata)]MCU7894701.1 hypothetical protein [Candidatus Thiodiazotropha sp. (ex Lucinoma aequizonata)]MCU7898102.1 hypothetical protein [Candidatus Thiodiazotropha sp. (ex Lucinoma aequizonata)]MCU7901717.1 hypothetical protein [Candidatus Thiodiazotropha sp. (ex Lucinoma aequizonata)]MCU7908355.1 hypothetical protein [Candidatus Thiodiazotropha sp. (ex Lucinoma aequizonata)]